MTVTAARFSSEIAFCWATGIEDTFIPQERAGLRALDEYALTQHYEQWQGDLARAAKTGAQAIRWGIPWYRVQPAPDQWDWEWTDRVLEEMVQKHNLIPILDLMHYGTPLWLENSFLHTDYPARVAEYMARAAERYAGLVTWYTPHNEPVVNAEWAGKKGEWPPYLLGEDGLVKVAMQVARGMALGSKAIRAADPKAVLLQVEALWHFTTNDPALEQYTSLLNEMCFLGWDLATGRVLKGHPLHGYLRRWGADDCDFAWFADNATHFDVFGVNYYPWSWGEHVADGSGGVVTKAGATSGATLGVILDKVHARYGMPQMVTETSALRDVAGRAQWMQETISAIRDARAAGVPVVGYTWFPMMTMFDWLYRSGDKPLQEYAIDLGLYDSTFDETGTFVRHETALVGQFAEFTRHLP